MGGLKLASTRDMANAIQDFHLMLKALDASISELSSRIEVLERNVPAELVGRDLGPHKQKPPKSLKK
jgi:predicted kinase